MRRWKSSWQCWTTAAKKQRKQRDPKSNISNQVVFSFCCASAGRARCACSCINVFKWKKEQLFITFYKWIYSVKIICRLGVHFERFSFCMNCVLVQTQYFLNVTNNIAIIRLHEVYFVAFPISSPYPFFSSIAIAFFSHRHHFYLLHGPFLPQLSQSFAHCEHIFHSLTTRSVSLLRSPLFSQMFRPPDVSQRRAGYYSGTWPNGIESTEAEKLWSGTRAQHEIIW